MSGILHIALLLPDFLNTQLFIVWSSVNNTLIDRQKVRKCTPSRTVAAVEFLPESAGYDSDRTHCMTCRISITTPPSRAVVSLTPSLRTMITTLFFFFNNSGWLRITIIQTGVLEAIFPEG